MRQDQYEKLQALSERLTDVFLDEAEPDNWPGKGMEVAAMDKQTRGDRYWCKKNAVGTLSLIQRVHGLVQIVQLTGGTDPGSADKDEAESELDAEIESAEKEAAKLMDKMLQRAKKANFDKRVHGKP